MFGIPAPDTPGSRTGPVMSNGDNASVELEEYDGEDYIVIDFGEGLIDFKVSEAIALAYKIYNLCESSRGARSRPQAS